MVNISIDSLSLSHSNDAPLLIAAPFGLSDTIGNTNITLGWQGALEASSFDIYRSVNYGNTNYVLRATVTNVWSYLDTNLTNLMLYNYKVVAKYAATNATSTNASFRARGKVDLLVWDAVGKVVGDTAVSQTNQVVVTNGSGGVVCNFYGNYTNGAIVGQGLGTYSGIPVYGVTQLTGSTAIVQYRMRTTFFDQTTQKNGDYRASNVCSSLMYIIATNGPINMATGVFTYEMKNDVAPATLRAAFRDSASGKWYVSHNNVDTNGLANGATSVVIDNMADPTNRWRELSIVQDNLMCGTNNPITVPSFTSVDAIGFLFERSQQNIRTTLLKISSVSPLPTYTISNLTTDVRGMVENNTTTPTNNPLVVLYGDSPIFTITATNGFRIATLKTNGADVADMTFSNTSTKATFTWYNVTSNGTLAATFTERLYTLAVTNGTGSGVDMYTNGQHVAIVASNVVDGQIFTYWTGNTNYLIATNVFEATNTVVMGTRNIQLTANYRLLELTVIGGSGSGSYYAGTELTIVATNPPSGYVFDQWVGNTYYVGNVYDASTTVTMPAADVTVASTYKSAAVELTATVSGGNGTITPASASVSPGNSTNFVITANNYYRIATLTTNGASAGVAFNNLSTNYTYTWSNVQAAGTVTVSFVQQVTTNAPATVPYSWLAGYFTTNDYDACANADQDGDGMKTWQEYIALTVPTNKASLFAAAQSNRNVVTWSPVTGRLYSVHWTTNLAGKAFSNKQDNIVHPQGIYTNTTPDSRVNLYQVRVRMQ
jgi:hypothetical protein